MDPLFDQSRDPGVVGVVLTTGRSGGTGNRRCDRELRLGRCMACPGSDHPRCLFTFLPGEWSAGADRLPSMTSGSGFFSAFEGGEGAGKSTQATALAAYFTAAGRDVEVTREPGGAPIGAAIRALLVDPANHDPSARSVALLYAADGAQHVATLVEPAIRRGAAVITDRYLDSTVAYRGAARPLDPWEALMADLMAKFRR